MLLSPSHKELVSMLDCQSPSNRLNQKTNAVFSNTRPSILDKILSDKAQKGKNPFQIQNGLRSTINVSTGLSLAVKSSAIA